MHTLFSYSIPNPTGKACAASLVPFSINNTILAHYQGSRIAKYLLEIKKKKSVHQPANFFWLYWIIQHPFSSTDNAHDRCTTGVQHLVRRLINTSHWVYIFWCAGTVWRCDDWRQQHLQRCWDPAGVVESPWLPSLILLKSVSSACYIAHCYSARL